MPRRTAFLGVSAAALAVLLTLPAHAVPVSSTGLELPVNMRANVVAGRTPVGTRIQAKLTVATLVNGVVVPPGAILSGEVIASAARTATAPSRLSIRMDSARWKKGSTPIKVYLTAWYYPIAQLVTSLSPDPPPDPTDAVHGSISWSGSAGKNRNSQATPPSQPFPDSADRDATLPPPPTPQPNNSPHRVLMKDVETTRDEGKDAAVTLTSTHFNIRLDKQTTYVLATSDLSAATH